MQSVKQCGLAKNDEAAVTSRIRAKTYRDESKFYMIRTEKTNRDASDPNIKRKGKNKMHIRTPMKADKLQIYKKLTYPEAKNHRYYITKIVSTNKKPYTKQNIRRLYITAISRLRDFEREKEIDKQSCPLLRTNLRFKSLLPSCSERINLKLTANFKLVLEEKEKMSDANKRVRSPEGNVSSGKKRCDPRAEAIQPHLEKATQAKIAAAARLARLRAEEATRQTPTPNLSVPPANDALQEAILASQIEMGASATPRPSSFVLPGFEKTAQAAGLEVTLKIKNIDNYKTINCLRKLRENSASNQKKLLTQAQIRADALQENLEAEMDAIINGTDTGTHSSQAAGKTALKKPTKIPVRESGFAPSSARKTGGRGRPKATATVTRPTPVLSEYEDDEDNVSVDSNNNNPVNNDSRPMMNIIRDIVQEKTSQSQPEGYVTEINQVIRDEEGRVPELAKAKPTTVAQLMPPVQAEGAWYNKPGYGSQHVIQNEPH